MLRTFCRRSYPSFYRNFPLKHPVITLWTQTYPLWFTDYEWCSESPEMSFLKIMHLNMYHFLSITNVVLPFFDKEYGLTLLYLINIIFMSCQQWLCIVFEISSFSTENGFCCCFGFSNTGDSQRYCSCNFLVQVPGISYSEINVSFLNLFPV